MGWTAPCPMSACSASRALPLDAGLWGPSGADDSACDKQGDPRLSTQSIGRTLPPPPPCPQRCLGHNRWAPEDGRRRGRREAPQVRSGVVRFEWALKPMVAWKPMWVPRRHQFSTKTPSLPISGQNYGRPPLAVLSRSRATPDRNSKSTPCDVGWRLPETAGFDKNASLMRK